MARTSLYPPSVDAGFPRLPSTPSGWSRTTFGALVEPIERPVTLAPTHTYQLVTAKRSRGGIVSRGTLFGREILTKTQFEVKAGDFVISRRQIIHGACGVAPPELDGAIVSNEYSTLRTRPALLMNFLEHYSHTPYFQRTCFHSSHGVDVEKMIFKIDEWLTREVDVPPIAEQRKIAAILSSVDDAIETSQTVIDQLQNVKKAMIAELFARGLPGQHTRFKQTELGEVPDAWQTPLLDHVTKRGSGHTPSKSHPEYWNGDIKWVSLADSSRLDRLYINDTSSKITPAGIANSSAVEHPAGTVVLSRDGARVGKSGILMDAMAVSQHFIAWACSENLDNHFLYYWLQHKKPDFARIATGSTTNKTIGLPYFKAMRVPLPPIDEQRSVARTLTSFDLRVFEEAAALESLRTLKNALLDALLTGEIRVTLDEEAV